MRSPSRALDPMWGLKQRTAKAGPSQPNHGSPLGHVVPEEPAGPGVAQPTAEAQAAPPAVPRRGRRRARAELDELLRLRDARLRDLGGFVFDLYRFGQQRDGIVREKLEALIATDDELRELQGSPRSPDHAGAVTPTRPAALAPNRAANPQPAPAPAPDPPAASAQWRPPGPAAVDFESPPPAPAPPQQEAESPPTQGDPSPWLVASVSAPQQRAARPSQPPADPATSVWTAGARGPERDPHEPARAQKRSRTPFDSAARIAAQARRAAKARRERPPDRDDALPPAASPWMPDTAGQQAAPPAAGDGPDEGDAR